MSDAALREALESQTPLSLDAARAACAAEPPWTQIAGCVAHSRARCYFSR
jgi:hypothetical protein